MVEANWWARKWWWKCIFFLKRITSNEIEENKQEVSIIVCRQRESTLSVPQINKETIIFHTICELLAKNKYVHFTISQAKRMNIPGKKEAIKWHCRCACDNVDNGDNHWTTYPLNDYVRPYTHGYTIQPAIKIRMTHYIYTTNLTLCATSRRPVHILRHARRQIECAL